MFIDHAVNLRGLVGQDIICVLTKSGLQGFTNIHRQLEGMDGGDSEVLESGQS